MHEPAERMDSYGASVGRELLALSDAALRPFDAVAIARASVVARTPSRRARWKLVLAVGLICVTTAAGFAAGSRWVTPTPSLVAEPTLGHFEPTGPMFFVRFEHTLTGLPDGGALAVGGRSQGQDNLLTTLERWDPASGSFVAAGYLHTPRKDHTATLLADGRVLIVGGRDAPGTVVGEAEVWSPRSRQNERVGSDGLGRYGHTATLMPDGRVLIVGGVANFGRLSRSTAWWDPETQTFTGGPDLGTARFDHTATLLPDGRVLVVGGRASLDESAESLATVEILEVGATSFRPAASLQVARYGHTATLLPDGSILVVGGGSTADQERGLASAEVWDSTSEAFVSTGPPTYGVLGHTASLLPDGRVLIVGGASRPCCEPVGQATSMIWNPATSTFQLAAVTTHDYVGHGAVALSDGRVLVAGASVASQTTTCNGREPPSTGRCVGVSSVRTTHESTSELYAPDGDPAQP